MWLETAQALSIKLYALQDPVSQLYDHDLTNNPPPPTTHTQHITHTHTHLYFCLGQIYIFIHKKRKKFAFEYYAFSAHIYKQRIAWCSQICYLLRCGFARNPFHTLSLSLSWITRQGNLLCSLDFEIHLLWS